MSTDSHGIRILLTCIALILIGGGAILTYFFATTAYQFIEAPADVKLLQFILTKLPETTEPYTITGNIDGSEFSISIPNEISIFFLVILGLMAFRVVGSIAIDLIKGGTKIITSIWESPKKKKTTSQS